LLIFLVPCCCTAKIPAAAKTLQQSQDASPTLSQDDVLAMVKSGLAAEVIIAKLQRSTCTCDVSATELNRLKSEGVPDDVLLAMINAARPGRNDSRAITIPRDTVVEIESAYRINSQEIAAGEAITFRVVNPVKIGDAIVIEPGAIATGRVTQAKRGAHFGRAGRLVWHLENVLAVDGTKVPIKSQGRVVGDSKGAKVATQIVLTGALLWPIAPIALLHGLKRGENAYIPQGRRFEALVSGDTTIHRKVIPN